MDGLIRLLAIDLRQRKEINIDQLLITDQKDLHIEIDECSDESTIQTTLKRHNYNCILIDCIIRDLCCFQVMEKIREVTKNTPIVVIINELDDGYGEELIRFGASYIVEEKRLYQNRHNLLSLIKAENVRKRTEHELNVSKNKLAEAQSLAKIGSWEYVLNNDQISWSDEMYEIFEKDPKKFAPTSDHFVTLFHPVDQPKIRQGIDRASSGEVINIDVRILFPKNRVKHVNFNAYFQMDASDNFDIFVGTIQDIEERKQFENELIKATQQAEESGRIKEQFLANMSHEIRTPMNSIIGFTELLLKNRSNLTSDQIQYLNTIQLSGNNLLTIINDILDFSKMESGNMPIENVRFDLINLIGDTFHSLEHMAKNKDLSFSYDIDKSVPRYVNSDFVRLNQVLVNLLNNAVKFTERGFIKLSVKSPKTTKKKRFIRFIVEDTGIGIEKEKINTIFNSFTQANSKTARKYGGTGLGLAIVKKIVELMKGTVEIESKIGRGTKFAIELPFRIPKEDRKINVIQKEMKKEELNTNINRHVKILMAEDNVLNQELVKVIIGDIGWDLDIAENGIEVLEKLSKNSYDLILMDIQMPEMDGYEATLKIRNELTLPASKIPIIAITAHAIKREIDKCFHVGMNGYISKPFRSKELIDKVTSILNETKEITNDRPPVEKKNSRPPVNLKNLTELAGTNAATINKILNLFLEEMHQPGNKLFDSAESKDWQQLKTLCHKMKSSYAMIGALSTKEILETIESKCEEDQVNENKIIDLLHKFDEIHGEVYKFVKNKVEMEIA